jgi:hypothetical protein
MRQENAQTECHNCQQHLSVCKPHRGVTNKKLWQKEVTWKRKATLYTGSSKMVPAYLCCCSTEALGFLLQGVD